MGDTGDVELSEAIRSGLNGVIAKELGSDKIDVEIEAGSKKGDNYVGIVYRVTGKLSKSISNGNVNDKKSSISLILKVAPTTEVRREQFFSRVCFLREIKMYDEVLPMFRRFQQSKGIIPEENGFHEYPKCYKTIDTEIEETLIFQDLKVDGFEMFDRYKLITIDHVRLIMKALGKYHGLSYALRDQQPEKLRSLSTLEEVFNKPSDKNLDAYYKYAQDDVYSSLDQEGDEGLLEKVKELFKTNHNTLMQQCVNGKSAEPYAVICHGDCWNNNLLFKYNESQKPIDMRFLDWQVSRYASPVTDLTYYIFCCTTKPLRDQYYDDMLKTYHDSLSEMITRLGSDPAKLFPFAALQDQLRKFGKFGLVMATLLLQMLTSAVENAPDLDEVAEMFSKDGEADFVNSVFAPDKTVYNKRMRDVVVDMDRFGYL